MVFRSSGYIDPLIEVGMWEKVIVEYIESPENFYCRLVSSEVELNSLMEQLEMYCSKLRPGEWSLLAVSASEVDTHALGERLVQKKRNCGSVGCCCGYHTRRLRTHRCNVCV